MHVPLPLQVSAVHPNLFRTPYYIIKITNFSNPIHPGQLFQVTHTLCKLILKKEFRRRNSFTGICMGSCFPAQKKSMKKLFFCTTYLPIDPEFYVFHFFGRPCDSNDKLSRQKKYAIQI